MEAADRLRDEPLIFAIVGSGAQSAAGKRQRSSVDCAKYVIFPLTADALPALLKMGIAIWWCKRGAADAGIAGRNPTKYS